MIIATAGHVDHGKTRLVKALTGVDTDTLVEEKKRGLTINIGFAYLALEGNRPIGFIDVPGHQRFIKNALCGLAATDFVLLVIAADDGPMPQTREHLAIVDLLGIRQAAIAITKLDRVSAARAAEVDCQVASLVKGTTLENAPLFPVSPVSGDGIDALRDYLIDQAKATALARVNGKPLNNFRLAVDRSFDVNGVGLIATGTIFSGEIRVAEKVTICGTEMQLRVRGLRVQSVDAVYARQGQRCALNLSGPGLRKEQIKRGNWVTSERVPPPVRRFDAELRLLNQATRPLAHWTPVRVHLAACEVSARVAVLEGRNIRPGTSALVQIVTDNPIGSVFGDRFIIRDQSARMTLGGGHVVDISPPRRGRTSKDRITRLREMNSFDAQEALNRLLGGCPNGVNLDLFSANRNLTAEQESDLYGAVDMTTITIGQSRSGFSNNRWTELREMVLKALRTCHDKSPDVFGFADSELLAAIGSRLPGSVLKGLVEDLLIRSSIVKGAQGLCLSSHQIHMSRADEALWSVVDASLAKAGLKPMSVTEIMLDTGVDKPALTSFLERASRFRLLVRLTPKLFIKPQSLVKIDELLARLCRKNGDATFTVAAFRDTSGIGRNRSIEILELFDSKGITRRSGDGRRLLSTAQKAFAVLLKIAP